jgi:methanogenic corrinoid protein MtbC1
MPVRKPSGHRLYSAGAVEHLRRVARLLAHGHRPSEILPLSLPELDRMLSLSEPAPPPAPPTLEAQAVEGPQVAAAIERLMRAAMELNRGAMTQELRWGWARWGPIRFLQEVASEFMVAVGRAWSEGRLDVRHEHFASACLFDFLRAAREPFEQQAQGPRVVVATLPGEAHEGGLVMMSVLLAVRGHRALYLGLDTPIEEIVAGVRGGDAEAVAVSVSSAMARDRAAREIARLRKELPRRVALWVGGGGAPAQIAGVERFDSLSALDARIHPAD